MSVRVGIIGGGISGLVSGFVLSKAGFHVSIFEEAPRLGGLASSFSIAPGQEIERHYHFLCKPDAPYFEVLAELGIADRLRWTTTTMGLFCDGSLYQLGDPLGLLRFPYFSVMDKIRFGWATWLAKWGDIGSGRKGIDDVSARDWIIHQYGERVYDVLYRPLLELKFGEYAHRISASWMWARVHRLAKSRSIMQKEKIGYLNGGTQVYVTALQEAIRAEGGEIETSCRIDRVKSKSDGAIEAHSSAKRWSFDYLISTISIPKAVGLFAELEGTYFEGLKRLNYIGVVTMVLRIKEPLSPCFWLNINDRNMDICGIIEYTNMNRAADSGGASILYIPQYVSASHPAYRVGDGDLLEKYCGYLKLINARFERSWVLGYWVHRDEIAQPICEVGFRDRIPAIQTPIGNLLLTDSYQLHPDDRTISNSTKLGRAAARLIIAKQLEK